MESIELKGLYEQYNVESRFLIIAQLVVIQSVKSLKNVAGFGRRTLRSSLALLSVVGAILESMPQDLGGIAQAWATWPEGASAPNGKLMCRGHRVPEMVTSTMRTTITLYYMLL